MQRALEKLDHAPDEAGACEECGEDIPWARLKAMPFAELCVACQGKRDRPHHGPTRRGLDGLPMSDRPELIRKVEAWSAADPDETTRAELQRLLAAEDLAELEDRFAGTLEFGTAGLRGVLGAGPNRMNRAVVRRTTAGLARYLKRHRAGRRPRAAWWSAATAGG